MKRIEVLRRLVSELRDRDIVVSCYSPTCHELYATKDRETNFYVRDSMGLPTSIGLGLALALPERKVIVLEGDGGLLMNLGSLATISNESPPNLLLIVLDNGCYENTGGQPTATAKQTDLEKIAKGAGIQKAFTIKSTGNLTKILKQNGPGPVFVVAKIERGRADVPPIPLQHIENKYRFVRALRSS
jgi:sulfopyruvate decarboxylase subunit beta